MKNFLRHKLVLSILSAILVLGIVAGGALAYTAVTNHAAVTVNEAVSVSAVSYDNSLGSWNSGTWTVNMYPNQTVSCTFDVVDAGPDAIEVTATAAPGGTYTGLTASWNYVTQWVGPGSGATAFTLTITASHDVVPGTASYTITFSR